MRILSYQKLHSLFTTTFITHSQYKFYVDFKGLLYFDDGTPFLYPNSIKDAKFITQFYKYLQPSTIKQNYPYFAEFWGERNFLRCAISPVIFSYLDKEGNLQFSLNQKCKFSPTELQLDSEGRIWHPFRDQIKGVFSNDLLTNCLEQVENREGRITLKYKGQKYEIKKKE